jgi:hypothetical protein
VQKRFNPGEQKRNNLTAKFAKNAEIVIIGIQGGGGQKGTEVVKIN